MSSKNKRFKASAKATARPTLGSNPWTEGLAHAYPIEGPWLQKMLDRLVKRCDFGYEDNLRVCVVGDAPGEAEYDAARRHGCCGFCDEEFVHPKTNRKFRIGFNGGH